MSVFDVLAHIINRGEQASTLLANPAFQEALAVTRQGYLEEIARSPAKDVEARERMYMAVRVLHDVEAKLRSYVDNAAYEKKRQDQQVQRDIGDLDTF